MSARTLLGSRLAVLLLLLGVLASPSAAVTVSDNRSIVAIVSELDPAGRTAEAYVQRSGGTVLSELSVVDGFTARIPRRLLPALSRLPGVRFATPNRSLHLLGQYGQDSGTASAVYSDVIRASKTWAAGVTGAGVNVAVIDTGVDTSGDLAGRVVHAEDFTVEADNADSFGHGTFVAGMIAGTGAASSGAVKGVAPGAGIVSLKIAGRDGSTDVTMVLEALEWLVTHQTDYGIRVVNLSLGFDSTQSYTVDPLDFAVERVWNSGLVVVTAAGNTPGAVTTPGNDPFVITVGATNDRTTLTIGDDNVASFSGGATTGDSVVKPDLYAPGRSVVSSRSPGSTIDLSNPTSAIGTSYAKASGTSFSTAVVSGTAALVLARTPTLTPNQVKQRLVGTSRPFGANLTPHLVDAWGATMSVDSASANAGLTASNGSGSLQATRGSSCIQGADGACLSDADANALLGFDSAAYFGDSWAGSQWLGSQWLGSQWLGSQWLGSQWLGSQWLGSQWLGGPWTSSAWAMAPEG